MNKIYSKGQMGKTVSIILILAGAIVLFLFISKVGAKSTYDQSINACRLSVLAQSSTEVGFSASGRKSPFDVNCDKRYITFYNTRVELGLSPENMKPVPVIYGGRKVTKFKTLSDSVVNNIISEEMRICKYQFADGKVDIFVNNDNIFLTKKICFICSEINFENQNIEKIEFKTLLDYTKKTKFNDDQTYYSYFIERTRANNSMWIQPIIGSGEISQYGEEYSRLTKENYEPILTSKKYYIVIQKFNKGSLLSGSNIAKEWNDPSFLAIIPSEKINDYCDIQGS